MPRAGGIQKGGAQHFGLITGCEKSGTIQDKRPMFGAGNVDKATEERGSANNSSERIIIVLAVLYSRLLSETGWGETGGMKVYFMVAKALLAESYDIRRDLSMISYI